MGHPTGATEVFAPLSGDRDVKPDNTAAKGAKSA